MLVTVLGNCQVGGVADALGKLCVGLKANASMYTGKRASLKSKIRRQVQGRSNVLLIHESILNLPEYDDLLFPFVDSQVVVFPSITFAAFQPDIQYAFVNGAVVKNGLGGEWNSRIILWAYMNGLTPTKTECLFCEEVFDALGYFDEWEKSTESLRASFETCGLDYGRWVRAVQRTGVFMHGINHPMQIGLSQLTLQIAEKVFPHSVKESIDLEKITKDRLRSIVWPVYPEIGSCLGVEGSYHWQSARKDADLAEFISLCFATWDEYQLKNKNLNLIPVLTVEESQQMKRFVGA